IAHEKTFLALFLEDIKIPRDIEFQINIFQHLLKYKYDDTTYKEKLRQVLPDIATSIKSMETVGTKSIFAGLDNSGKTSIILALQFKYNHMINVQPTKGSCRDKSEIMGMTVSTWDLGGQHQYREDYLKASELFFFDLDILNYIVDICDGNRLQESIDYFKQILEVERHFEQIPVIVVWLHKIDKLNENTIYSRTYRPDIPKIKQMFKDIARDYTVVFFETSIFQPGTLTAAYSYGLRVRTPNRALFRNVLADFSKKVCSSAVLLINTHQFIMSDYARDETTGVSLELIAPMVLTMCKRFVEMAKPASQIMVISMNGARILTRRYEFHEMDVYLLVYLENACEIDAIGAELDGFKEDVNDLLNLYKKEL
nr:ADP-ribosylation factor-like protein [Candidatus Sigynarchaeota archaeon]